MNAESGILQNYRCALDVLKTNPSRIDLRLLNQFPEFVAFRTPTDERGELKAESVPQTVSEKDKWTPEDHLEYRYERIREQLVTDLLLKVKEGSPAFLTRDPSRGSDRGNFLI